MSRAATLVMASTVALLCVCCFFGKASVIHGNKFLGLDGGCGATCGIHAQETMSEKNVQNRTLNEAYLHSVFNLTNDCGYPVRLPNPVIPGVDADGGYVVCDEPEVNWRKGDCSLFSFGVASDDSFELAFAKRYRCEVHEFDPTVNGSKGADTGELVHFHKLGCWKEKGNLSIGPVDTIENLVSRFHKKGNSLNLKIDVEGSEWETLPAVPDSLLDRVDHLIMEAHTTVSQIPLKPGFFTPTLSMIETMARLREKFYLVHYHVNNCCTPTEHGPNYWVPGPVELTFVRKALMPGVPVGPFQLHEEMNGPNVVGLPEWTSNQFYRFAWWGPYGESWERYTK